MKILFLTLLFEREKEAEYKQKAGGEVQNASNTFQYALLDGIFENGRENDIFVCNSLPVGTYKKQYSELFLKGEEFRYGNKVVGKTLPCVNVHILKQLTRYIGCRRLIKEFIKRNRGEEIKILTYNLYPPYVKVAAKFAKKYPNTEFCPIITDMPGSLGILPAGWRKYYYLIQAKGIFRNLKYADKFVFLTELMKNPLHVENNYMVMEGIYSDIDRANNSSSTVKSDKKIILYTGTLKKEFGIRTLIEGFLLSKREDAELWICGGGEGREFVEKTAQENPSVKFFGSVDRAEALEKQRSADLLFNPRPAEGEFVKYSFPSKTMEYMASGKPVAMFKLPGIPAEYDKYLNYVKENTPLSVKETIEEILSDKYAECVKKAEAGKEFIFEYKNSRVQAQRLIEFLESARK